MQDEARGEERERVKDKGRLVWTGTIMTSVTVINTIITIVVTSINIIITSNDDYCYSTIITIAPVEHRRLALLDVGGERGLLLAQPRGPPARG